MSKYMTAKEAAEYLDISPRTVYRWLDDGKLTAVEIGGVLHIKTASVVYLKKYMRRFKYPGQVFSAGLLFRYSCERGKYDLVKNKKGDACCLSLNQNYLKRLSKKERDRKYFKPIRFHEVRLDNKYQVMVIDDRNFDRLPRAEKAWWLGFKLSPKRLRNEMAR